MRITDWPAAERPRERLLTHGAAALSDAELLAIFLRTGIAGKSALDLARELVAQHGSLARLAAASHQKLTQTAGIGPAKAAQLQAALELARRALDEQMRTRDALSSPQSVRDYLRLTLSGRDYEVFMAVLLDAQNRVIAAEELFRGTLTQTSVYPREIVKFALAHGAAAIIFAHNHPSGLAEHIQADELLTRTLRQALALVDIRVLDHFIVGEGAAMSFAERGLI
ncbi:MAG: DNA repair protein RadC [Proteobacteria bacterium]|nr:DNA repair protein RadC [Pseudomonadota bacterium]